MHNQRSHHRPQRRQIDLQLPPLPSLDGSPQKRGTIRVLHGGKAPRLSFQPGWYIRLDGELLVIMYAFRLQDNPDIWIYSCQRRDSLEPVQATDSLMAVSMAADASGSVSDQTPRVVTHLFRNRNDVHQYFSALYLFTDPCERTTAQLQLGTLVSSGEVLPPKEGDKG